MFVYFYFFALVVNNLTTDCSFHVSLLATDKCTIHCENRVSVIQTAPLGYASVPFNESGNFVFSLLNGNKHEIEAGVGSL